jgi:hypothetical protein
MQNWGINVVRLGWQWEYYETGPNVFNETYLDAVFDVVRTLASHRIYSGQVALALFVSYLVGNAEAYPPEFYVSSWAAYLCV